MVNNMHFFSTSAVLIQHLRVVPGYVIPSEIIRNQNDNVLRLGCHDAAHQEEEGEEQHDGLGGQLVGGQHQVSTGHLC